ncbi:LysR family transcriptional regulator [Vibrio porteresiae]|uniref:LysR family transcriptional regulator n=1 Tax=Vibrio porteresiae DSM 19223 TaxID=1123496 RepID=A0ABZ0QDI1_9VIBR|nr:LysR family transcriptional regulator [Vibrio porteresiae]WPC74513.1 LysR family transcriptional regulator [Vibrio porteresiae DSM 19223]
MEIRVLRYFEAIARLQNVTRAATELHVAQPSLSVAIKKLEEELGVLLFTRVRNQPLKLTEEGHLLLKRSKRIFSEIERVEQEIADRQKLRSGHLRIGLPQMYGYTEFPHILKLFHQTYPGIRISVIQNSASTIRSHFEEGQLNLAIIDERRIHKKWPRLSLERQEMVVSCAHDHPLAQKESIKDNELEYLPLILMDDSFLQRNIIDKRCEQAGFRPNVIIESNYIPMIVQATLDGLGVSTLLREVVEQTPNLHAMSLVPKEYCHFHLCWLDEDSLSQAEHAFIRFVSDFKNKLKLEKQSITTLA